MTESIQPLTVGPVAFDVSGTRGSNTVDIWLEVYSQPVDSSTCTALDVYMDTTGASGGLPFGARIVFKFHNASGAFDYDPGTGCFGPSDCHQHVTQTKDPTWGWWGSPTWVLDRISFQVAPKTNPAIGTLSWRAHGTLTESVPACVYGAEPNPTSEIATAVNMEILLAVMAAMGLGPEAMFIWGFIMGWP